MAWNPLFKGDRSQKQITLPPPPPWRRFDEQRPARGSLYQSSPLEIELVNAAITLRRPLLITGNPGSGKSSLAYAVAYELSLGEVLVWPITSRTTLLDGLYRYDAVGRLQDKSLQETSPGVEHYLRLGPLATALASPTPRVLLIDEIDKSDIDLPNDLLHIFEEGSFTIPELERDSRDEHDIRPADGGNPFIIHNGRVQCTDFPIVFFTSNGEREFPPAFLRRCLRLDFKQIEREKLVAIVREHLGAGVLSLADPLISEFLTRVNQRNELLATDQLLNAIFLLANEQGPEGADWESLKAAVLRSLSGE